LIEAQLDFFGVDVVAAADDQVLVATDDTDVALVVQLAEVARAKKPSSVNSSAVFSGIRQ